MNMTSIGGGPAAVPPILPARAATTPTTTAPSSGSRPPAQHDAPRPKPLPPLRGLSVQDVRVILGAMRAPHLPAKADQSSDDPGTTDPADGGQGFDTYA